jgi:hypothetical protein
MRSEEEQRIAKAIMHLKLARTLLAKAPRSLAKVKAAIKSAEGAERHARGMATR